MKITVDRRVFIEAFQSVSAVCPSRTPYDILKNVLFKFSPEGGELIGSDSEMGLKIGLELKSNGTGVVLLPSARVTSILGSLVGDEISFNTNDRSCDIQCAGAKFSLSIQDPENFPAVENFDESGFRGVPAVELKLAIRKSIIATDTTNNRYAFGGIALDVDDKAKAMHLVATDSKRLAVCKCDFQLSGENESVTDFRVVPVKTMNIIEKILGNSGECQIAIRPNMIYFRHDGAAVVSKYVMGRFPDWKKIIPCHPYKISMVVNPLKLAVQQAMIVTSEESRGVDFSFESGVLRLKSRAIEVGSSEIEIPIPFNGPTIKTTFDPKFIMDYLRVLDSGSTFDLSLKDSEDHLLCEQGTNKYLIVPFAQD